MPHAPGSGDAEVWPERFAHTFPGARHMAFGVDTADGDVGNAAALEALGFAVIRYSVPTCAATRSHPPPGHGPRPAPADH